LLYRIIDHLLYIGPTIGFVSYEYNKSTNEQNPYDLNEVTLKYITDEVGIYLAGIKASCVFGEKTVRCKIQERLLIGIQGDRKTINRYGLFNSITAGISFAI
jgi:hypothetical protein